MLSWALQLELPDHYRFAPGHHRAKGEHAMARKYSCDVVWTSLRAQWAILVSVQGGWVLMTAQCRVGFPPVQKGAPSLHLAAELVEPQFLKLAVSFRLGAQPEADEKSSSSSDSSSNSEGEGLEPALQRSATAGRVDIHRKTLASCVAISYLGPIIRRFARTLALASFQGRFGTTGPASPQRQLSKPFGIRPTQTQPFHPTILSFAATTPSDFVRSHCPEYSYCSAGFEWGKTV
ncbi:unnamed protein product [Polarella glacialis]|uniref:Uncharacterized protein n=1 Tax=Polarella glacialis TaxID=89957 RepID=A0A813HF19_POLGL|nr:unnamed protein product [Polarella glacialis]